MIIIILCKMAVSISLVSPASGHSYGTLRAKYALPPVVFYVVPYKNRRRCGLVSKRTTRGSVFLALHVVGRLLVAVYFIFRWLDRSDSIQIAAICSVRASPLSKPISYCVI